MTSIRLEAEAMTLTGGYIVESGTFASSGQYIGLLNGSTGTASATFTGTSGTYNVIVGYYDESDGKSEVVVRIGGNEVDRWLFDNSAGGTRASATNFKTRTLTAAPIALTTGALVEIAGVVQSGEVARIDYIQFMPTEADAAPPNAVLNPRDMAVAEGDSRSYVFTVDYTDNLSISSSTVDNRDLRVRASNGTEYQASLVRVDADAAGTALKAVYAIAAPTGGWSLDNSGTYEIIAQANEIVDSYGNTLPTGVIGTFQVQIAPAQINGTDSDNVLVGNVANNLMQGLNGNDTLIVGAGRNTVDGGSGNDTADYTQATNGIIADLGKGQVLKPVYGTMTLPRVMPLGDSITAGEHKINPVPGAYRTQLWQRLVADGLVVDFVGSKSNGPSSLGDKNHEGTPGITTDGIYNKVTQGQLDTYQPDVLMLMVGTNNVGNVSEMYGDLSRLIDEITQRLPNAQLLVSSIPPKKGVSQVNDYNALLPGLVEEKAAQGKKVTFVNAGGTLTTADLTTDVVHPTAAGYDKLGNAWYDGLVPQDTLLSIENVVGSGFDDLITGNAAANVIQGGLGHDRLAGGGGPDQFAYSSALEGGDRIIDFDGNDSFLISASGFGGGLTAGVALSTTAANTGVFVSSSNPTVLGSSANFLYNISNGELHFDRDGTGSGFAPVLIAKLDNTPSLSASQFTITA